MGTLARGPRRAAALAWTSSLVAAAIFTLMAGRGGAADVVVPGGMQASMAVRILEYDRGLRTWAGTAVTVGIVARSDPGASAFRDALAGRDAQGLPIRAVEHTYKDAAGLKAWMERAGVRLLYVAPDVGADGAAALSAGVDQRLPTLVATRSQFQGGATLGLVVRDGRPHILVNLPSSKAAGMNLDPKLLQLSEVVR
jgi:hypothetical protein